MARYRSYRKNQVKSIFTAVISIALVVAVLAGLGALFTRESKRISPTVFSVGGIHNDGKHVAVKTSIYTKDFIECQGLSIEPDFEAKGTFQVFYYDENKYFLGASDVLDASEGVYNKTPEFLLAVYCRIMITPEIEVEEVADDDEPQETKIRFYEVIGYASDYSIYVNVDQDDRYILSDFNAEFVDNGFYYTLDENKNIITYNDDTAMSFEAFEVADHHEMLFDLRACTSLDELIVYFANEDGKALGNLATLTPVSSLGEGFYIVNIPKNAETCYISHDSSMTGGSMGGTPVIYVK